MNFSKSSALLFRPRQLLSLLVAILLFTASLLAQRPATPAKQPAQKEAAPRVPDPTFDGLLPADTYKVYGEVRNVGQLLNTVGLGDVVEPILKMSGEPQVLQSIVKFLKTNADPLTNSRLLFASWPVRQDVPNAFLAVEFATPEEAAKFSPKLERFLPDLLPTQTPQAEAKPAVSTEMTPGERGKQQLVSEPGAIATGSAKSNEPGKPLANERGKEVEARAKSELEKPTTTEPPKNVAGGFNPNAPPAVEPMPFVISHSGNLVFLSDKPFKFEKLHPASARALAEDQNFRIARDRFSAEPIFLYFNVQLEDKPQLRPAPPQPKISEEEKARIRAEEETRRQKEIENKVEEAKAAQEKDQNKPSEKGSKQGAPTLSGGQMFELLGIQEPQWPEAVGVALALDNNEYVVRALLIEPADRKRLPLPFVPSVISGPGFSADAPSVLPDDTELFVSASIDLAQTYEGMRKQAEAKAKASARRIPVSGKEPPLDTFAEFEKKAGFKIKDDLLPALGNEIAVAASLKSAEGLGLFGPPPAPKPSPSPGDGKAEQAKKGSDVFPMLLIAVKDRDAARRLMPHVLDGLGFGEANMIAQVERHEDAEIVSYAGMFAYAFVGNFLVVSESATVRHVIDAWSNRQTLSGNNVFRNFTRWQPRQTLGQIYVSPALMDSYREQLNKQAPKMDAALRDLLMSLSPAPQAISYSLSNEGFGQLHELHLPKDLVVAMVANTSATMSAFKEGSPGMNEMIAISMLLTIGKAEASYRATTGNGNYGSIEELINQHLVQKEMLGDEFQKKYGYHLGVVVAGDDFQATATPTEYGKTGTRSFFVDKSGVVRGDDHGGGLATVADKPVQP